MSAVLSLEKTCIIFIVRSLLEVKCQHLTDPGWRDSVRLRRQMATNSANLSSLELLLNHMVEHYPRRVTDELLQLLVPYHLKTLKLTKCRFALQDAEQYAAVLPRLANVRSLIHDRALQADPLPDLLAVQWAESLPNLTSVSLQDCPDRYRQTLEESVDQLAKANGVRWYGHVLRRNVDHALRRALELQVAGARKRGRLKMTWKRQVEEEEMQKILLFRVPNITHLNLARSQQITDKAFYNVDNLLPPRLASLDITGCHNLTNSAVRLLTELCGHSLRHLAVAYCNMDCTILYYLAGHSLSSCTWLASDAVGELDGIQEALSSHMNSLVYEYRFISEQLRGALGRLASAVSTEDSEDRMGGSDGGEGGSEPMEEGEVEAAAEGGDLGESIADDGGSGVIRDCEPRNNFCELGQALNESCQNQHTSSADGKVFPLGGLGERVTAEGVEGIAVEVRLGKSVEGEPGTDVCELGQASNESCQQQLSSVAGSQVSVMGELSVPPKSEQSFCVSSGGAEDRAQALSSSTVGWDAAECPEKSPTDSEDMAPTPSTAGCLAAGGGKCLEKSSKGIEEVADFRLAPSKSAHVQSSLDSTVSPEGMSRPVDFGCIESRNLLLEDSSATEEVQYSDVNDIEITICNNQTESVHGCPGHGDDDHAITGKSKSGTGSVSPCQDQLSTSQQPEGSIRTDTNNNHVECPGQKNDNHASASGSGRSNAMVIQSGNSFNAVDMIPKHEQPSTSQQGVGYIKLDDAPLPHGVQSLGVVDSEVSCPDVGSRSVPSASSTDKELATKQRKVTCLDETKDEDDDDGDQDGQSSSGTEDSGSFGLGTSVPVCDGCLHNSPYAHTPGKLFQPSLLSLDMVGIEFDSGQAVSCFKEFFSANRGIQNVNMCKSELNDDLLAVMATCCMDLKYLSLTDHSQISSDGVGLLVSQCKMLKNLHLRGAPFLDNTAFQPIIDQKIPLQALQAAETRINNEILLQLPAVIGPTLKELDLNWCDDVTTEGIHAMVSGCPKLEVFSVRQFVFTEGTLRSLASHCPRMKRLDLSGSEELTDMVLMEIIPSFRLLTELDISWILGINNPGIEAVLASCPLLTDLTLSGLKMIDEEPFLPIISDYSRWKRCQSLIRLKLHEQRLRERTGATSMSSDEEYEDLYVPLRSTSYAPLLQRMDLQYCDLVKDKILSEIVAVCCGSLSIVDYYGSKVEPKLLSSY